MKQNPRSKGRFLKETLFLPASLLFVTLFLIIPAASVLADSYEPNDTIENATPIVNGVPIESWIGTDGDVDLYTFTTSQAGTFHITLTSLPADYDMYLFWYNAAEETWDDVAFSNNWDLEDEEINEYLSYVGTFIIHIEGFEEVYSATDSYLLTASWPGGATPQAPTVTVTFPNGGETLAAGTTTNITYTATDPDTDDSSLHMAVEYSTNGGATWSMIASDSGNSGSYPWTVPSVSTTQARVKVTASDGSLTGNDTSNSNFTITQQPAGENELIVGTASGTSGGQATVALSLDNDDIVKGIQLDIGYNASVVTYVSGSATGRAAGMSFSASVVGSAVRVIMYY
ncbi:MAG: hypothetical protein KJ970_03625, partial [Candidatus Eisenbacteria bacterium]|nr:hypothetical protein [Candidatus Eisenbacteria bacterium]